MAPADTGFLESSVRVNKAGNRSGTVIAYNVRVPRRLYGFYYPAKALEFGWAAKPEGDPFFFEGVDRAAGTASAILQAGLLAALQEQNR